MIFSMLLLTAAPIAFAQDDVEYLEDQETKKKGRSRAETSQGTVREIQRGVYGKAGVGGAGYLGGFASFVDAGSFVSLGVGQDFVDQERRSMSWELGLTQGLHNGMDYLSQASFGCGPGAAPCVEGDLRTYGVQATIEFAIYPSRRFGIGLRAGGGAIWSPLLMDAEAYQTEVLSEFGVDPGLHNAFKPMVLGGPNIEYYTKLAHFSVGLDADVFYGIGWDLGYNVAGNLKYTFSRKN